MNNINFKANFISHINVKKLNSGKYQDKNVAFVELNTSSENDFNCLRENYYNWDYDNNLIRDIYFCFYKRRAKERGFEQERLFALTDQVNDYEHLNSDRILGYLQMTKENKDSTEIDLLQVNPEYLKMIEDPAYKRIGTGLIKSLFKLIPDKEFFLYSYDTAIDFYRKLGFQLCDARSNLMKIVRK